MDNFAKMAVFGLKLSNSGGMTHVHDTGYKFLFSHAELMRELLEVFAPPGVSELLDYATLRRETGGFITPAMPSPIPPCSPNFNPG